MPSRRRIGAALRDAFNGDSIQIGLDAILKFLEFLDLLLAAVALRARHHYLQENKKITDGELGPRKRLGAKHVIQAISDVLNDPDRHFPGWRQPPPPPFSD